jgi:hypothetical protein
MRLVLHAGLHKSGTTSVQGHWRAAFGRRGSVWYPTVPKRRLPGHHADVWPLLDAFTKQQAADLAWAGNLMRHTSRLPGFLSEATRNDVAAMLISSEELDRMQAADVPRLQALFAEHEVTLLLTVTRPLHRWCSGWQTLVKHGLAEYPRNAAPHVLSYGSLEPGRLAELATLLPAARRIVRVVRTSPHEESLAQDLVELAGLRWPDEAPLVAARNVSIGADVEILRRMNRADVSLGTVYGDRGKELLGRLGEAELEYVEKPELEALYEPPEELWLAAEQERMFLTQGAKEAGVEVVDPHGQLDDWLDREPASWYAEISRREAVVPELDAALPDAEMPDAELLWRVRQERSALAARLVKSRAQVAALRAELQALERTHQAQLARARTAGRGDRGEPELAPDPTVAGGGPPSGTRRLTLPRGWQRSGTKRRAGSAGHRGGCPPSRLLTAVAVRRVAAIRAEILGSSCAE